VCPRSGRCASALLPPLRAPPPDCGRSVWPALAVAWPPAAAGLLGSRAQAS